MLFILLLKKSTTLNSSGPIKSRTATATRTSGKARARPWRSKPTVPLSNAGLVTGVKLADATGGFRCYRRKVLETIDLDDIRSNGYAFQIEMGFRSSRKGFRIKEIPIVFVDRTDGTSKMSVAIAREAVWMVWRLRFRAMLGKL